MGGLRIATLWGLALELRYSFLLLIVCAFYGGVLLGKGADGVIVLLFGCASVLVHELGHAFVARRLGVPVVAIALHALGGETVLAGLPRRARDEAAIAVAGPLASLLCAALAGLLLWRTGSIWAELLIAINMLLAGLNLLPALPLDGGRILRALLSHRLGPLRGTRIASRFARAIALIAMVGGPLTGFWPSLLLGAVLLISLGEYEASLRSWAEGQAPQVEICVLAADGRPAGRRAARLGTTFVIEEHRYADEQRWVVRDLSGKILLETETPLGIDSGESAPGPAPGPGLLPR